MKYYIVYDIPEVNIIGKRIGPYDEKDTEYHANDIAYEGVENIRVISEEEINEYETEGEEIADSVGFTD